MGMNLGKICQNKTGTKVATTQDHVSFYFNLFDTFENCSCKTAKYHAKFHLGTDWSQQNTIRIAIKELLCRAMKIMISNSSV